MSALLRIGLTVALLNLGATLRCHLCANFEFQSGNPHVENLFSNRTDPSCVSATGGATVQCSAGQACVVYKGQVSGDTILGSFEVSTLIRDCGETSGQGDGCHSTGNVSSLVQNLVGLGSISVNGRMCQCSSDICVPDCSGFFVGDSCVTWVTLGLGGAVLLLILLVACCCCHCCCGSRNKGYLRGIAVVTTPGAGTTNTGYTNNYTP